MFITVLKAFSALLNNAIYPIEDGRYQVLSAKTYWSYRIVVESTLLVALLWAVTLGAILNWPAVVLANKFSALGVVQLYSALVCWEVARLFGQQKRQAYFDALFYD
jgi:hypothetical protein